MSAAVQKKRSTLRTEACQFLRWRRANGGKVFSLPPAWTYEGADPYPGRLRQARLAGGEAVELDVIFARGESRGQFA